MYSQSLNMCASLYEHFKYTLKDAGYYPPGAERLSDNRMFGMFHSCTDEHNKAVIMKSFGQPDGVVRIVFATMALTTNHTHHRPSWTHEILLHP